jgi:hypothetical protein
VRVAHRYHDAKWMPAAHRWPQLDASPAYGIGTHTMDHIFGMAKSSLGLKPGQARALELDFLRLAMAIANCRRAGHSARGYLLVLAPGVRQRVATWIKKYRTGSDVCCLLHNCTPSELAALRREKAQNAAGVTSARSGAGRRLSTAYLGMKIGEKALKRRIVRAEPGVQTCKEELDCLMDVKWDFRGVVPNGRAASSQLATEIG